MDHLHIFRGIDYSQQITVRHLLGHTSGLPDYFQQRGDDRGRSLQDELLYGDDQSWSFEDAIVRSKKLQPLFPPGQKGRAHYSDTNFQLLGKLIETIRSESFAALCQKSICRPLGLQKTYLYQDFRDATPKVMHYRSGLLEIPKAMSSFGPDGGIVSTASELLNFLDAFFMGRLFARSLLELSGNWNRIFFPLQAGLGIHRFKLPWILNPFGQVPELVGHSGLSGVLAYYDPAKKIMIAGTVNQVAHPSLSFRLAIKIMHNAIF